jgi:hypothetical protein
MSNHDDLRTCFPAECVCPNANDAASALEESDNDVFHPAVSILAVAESAGYC